jgi:hypothetical protein
MKMTNSPAAPDSNSAQSSKSSPQKLGNWGWPKLLLLVPPLVAVSLVGVTMRRFALNEPFFANSAFYVLFAMFSVYVGVLVTGESSVTSPRQWIMDNRVGIALTVIVASVVLLAVAPSYRVLADEANLVGVSKNLYYQRTANFATTGKWYFENYWNINLTIDRRPALFPFLVSLLHVVRGYHPENAFYVNAAIFILFVFSSYRLAKLLGGELFGAAAAILVATHPNTMVAARSAGFDLLSSFMLLIVIKSFVEYANQDSPKRLAILALHLCILAHVRYEGWALLLAAATVLIAFRLIRRSQLQGYGLLYSFIPIFLLPRYWQAVAKAHDAEQPLSASLFSIRHFIENSREYFRLVLQPLEVGGAHSPLLIILGVAGFVVVVTNLLEDLRNKKLSVLDLRQIAFIAVLFGLETVIAFSYAWGKSLHPASVRLFIWLDTFVAMNAAWFLTIIGRRLAAPIALLHRRSGAPVTLLSCFTLFAMHVPAASEGRFVNALILTRQASQTWDFFAKLGTKNILIMTDRPGLFTIMDYGALDISTATVSRDPLNELSRHLYKDLYLVQEVDLTTHKPLPAFDVWKDVALETDLEFQNTDSTSIRISHVKR